MTASPSSHNIQSNPQTPAGFRGWMLDKEKNEEQFAIEGYNESSAGDEPDVSPTTSSFPAKPFKGKRQFPCEECDWVFERASALKQHHLTHTGEKPHGCEMCGKRFSIMSNLRRHSRTCKVGKAYQARGLEWVGPSDALTTGTYKPVRTNKEDPLVKSEAIGEGDIDETQSQRSELKFSDNASRTGPIRPVESQARQYQAGLNPPLDPSVLNPQQYGAGSPYSSALLAGHVPPLPQNALAQSEITDERQYHHAAGPMSDTSTYPNGIFFANESPPTIPTPSNPASTPTMHHRSRTTSIEHPSVHYAPVETTPRFETHQHYQAQAFHDPGTASTFPVTGPYHGHLTPNESQTQPNGHQLVAHHGYTSNHVISYTDPVNGQAYHPVSTTHHQIPHHTHVPASHTPQVLYGQRYGEWVEQAINPGGSGVAMSSSIYQHPSPAHYYPNPVTTRRD